MDDLSLKMLMVLRCHVPVADLKGVFPVLTAQI